MSAATVIPFVAQSGESDVVLERHRIAYQAADAVLSFAETVKLVGIFVAGVIFFSGVMVFQSSEVERVGFPVLSVSLVAGAVLILLAAHLWSMVFRAQGWLLEIAIDSAVNSSPLLSNAQRARVMFAPERVATPAREHKSAA